MEPARREGILSATRAWTDGRQVGLDPRSAMDVGDEHPIQPVPGSSHGLLAQGESSRLRKSLLDICVSSGAAPVASDSPPSSCPPRPYQISHRSSGSMPTFCGGELAAGQNAAQMPANVSWQTEDGAEREGACGAQLMARTGDSGVATDQPPPSAGLKRAHPTDAFMRELAPSTSTTGSWLVREREQSRPRTSLAAAQCGSVFGQAGTTQACGAPKGTLLNNLLNNRHMHSERVPPLTVTRHSHAARACQRARRCCFGRTCASRSTPPSLPAVGPFDAGHRLLGRTPLPHDPGRVSGPCACALPPPADADRHGRCAPRTRREQIFGRLSGTQGSGHFPRMPAGRPR